MIDVEPGRVIEEIRLILQEGSTEYPESLAPYIRAAQNNFDNEFIEYAFFLNSNSVSANFMDCLLFLSTPYDEIAKLTQMDKRVIAIYATIFFDTSVFLGNPILKRSFIDGLPEQSDDEKIRKEMFKSTSAMGMRYLLVELGLPDEDMDIDKYQQDLFRLSYVKAHEQSNIHWKRDLKIALKFIKEAGTIGHMLKEKKSAFDLDGIEAVMQSEDFSEDRYPDHTYYS